MRYFIFSIVLVCTLSDAGAWATEPDDEITVYATKREQSLYDIPASVAVIDADGVQRAAAYSSAEDIVQQLAGVQAAVANGAQVAFQIRGVGAVDHQALTPTAAAVYVDGVFLSTNVQTGPLLYDIQRIEVLKGPQGALYGRNASSGAIHFRTARPDPDQDGYIILSAGNSERFDGSAAFGGEIADGLSARAAGRFLTQASLLKNVDSDPAAPDGPQRAGGEREEFGLRTSLLWNRSASLSLLLRAHLEADKGVNPSPRNSSLSLGKHRISIGPDGVQDTDNIFYGASAEAEGKIGKWDFYSLTALEGYSQQYGFDFDGTEAPFGNPDLNANLRYDRNLRQISEEVRFARDFGSAHVLAGATAARETFDQNYLIWCGILDPATLIGSCPYVGAAGRVGPSPASPARAMTLVTDIEQDRIAAAVFTSTDIRITDKLTATLGARYTLEDIKGRGSGRHIFEDGVTAFNNRDGAGAAIGSNRIEENRINVSSAVSWRPNVRTTIYASFANGYKSGGFNGEVQNNAAHFSNEGLFRAETVNAFELGYKGRPRDDLRIAGALFYQDYNRPQARIFVAFPLPDGGVITSNSLSNLDSARSYGFEGEIALSPLSGLEIFTGFAFLESEIEQTANIGGNAALFDGNPLPFASRFSTAASVKYEWRVTAATAGRISANMKHQSAFYLDAEGLKARRQAGYAIVDAEMAIVHKPSNLTLSLWARNVLDTEYAVSGFGFIGYNRFLGEPRTYGVRASKQF